MRQGAYVGAAPAATICAALTTVLLRSNSTPTQVIAAAPRPALNGSVSAVAGEYLSPLAPGEAYAERLYLLRRSPLWSRTCSTLPAGDVDSVPLRIAFTVPCISDKLRRRLMATYGPPQTQDAVTAALVDALTLPAD